MSLMGVKRTWAIALHMSAFDPKRTWALMLCYAAVGLRTPSALIARSFTNIGSRSPVAVTLTIALAINSVIGSSRFAKRRSIKARLHTLRS